MTDYGDPRDLFTRSLDRPAPDRLHVFRRLRAVAEARAPFDADMLADCLRALEPDPRAYLHDDDMWLAIAVPEDPPEEKPYLAYIHYDTTARRLEASNGSRLHIVQNADRPTEWHSAHGLPLTLPCDIRWPDMDRVLPPPDGLAPPIEFDLAKAPSPHYDPRRLPAPHPNARPTSLPPPPRHAGRELPPDRHLPLPHLPDHPQPTRALRIHPSRLPASPRPHHAPPSPLDTRGTTHPNGETTVIKLERTDSGIAVQSPYNQDFVRGAKSLGGKWEKPFWHFDARDTGRVEQLLADIYGWTRPLDDEPLVTLHLSVGERPWSKPCGPLMIAGIVLAQAYGPDRTAKPGDGVIITEGSATGAGSKDNWHTTAAPGTVFEIRDLPTGTPPQPPAPCSRSATSPNPRRMPSSRQPLTAASAAPPSSTHPTPPRAKPRSHRYAHS